MPGSHRSSLPVLLPFHACSSLTLLPLSLSVCLPLSLPLSWRVAMFSAQFQNFHEWLRGMQTDQAVKWDRLKCTSQISCPSDELPLCSVSNYSSDCGIIIWIKRLQPLLHLVIAACLVSVDVACWCVPSLQHRYGSVGNKGVCFQLCFSVVTEGLC